MASFTDTVQTSSRSFEQIAPRCHENGIHSGMLLSWQEDPDHRQSLTKLEKITNEIVLELCKVKDQHNDSFQALHCWLKELHGRNWPAEQAPSYQAITRCTSRLSARLNKLKKQHDDQPKKHKSISTFLQLEFALPSMGYH